MIKSEMFMYGSSITGALGWRMWFLTRCILLFAAAWIPISSAQAEVLFGPVTNRLNGHSYFLLNQGTWTAAQAQAVSMGGHLVTISDAFEEHFLSLYFSCWGGTFIHLWTGLRRDPTPPFQFRWENGEPTNYSHWATSWPAPGIARDYVYINVAFNGWENGANDAFRGDSRFEPYAVVEIDQPSAGARYGSLLATKVEKSFLASSQSNHIRVQAALPQVIEGPRTNPINGHYYYLLEPSKWVEANEAARYLGGYLFVPEDRDEESLVYSWFNIDRSHPQERRRHLWMGLSDMNFDGVYDWDSNENTKYLNWTRGNPDFAGAVERFGHLTDYTQGWNDAANDPTAQWGPGFSRPFGVVEVNPAQLTPMPQDFIRLEATSSHQLVIRRRDPNPKRPQKIVIEHAAAINGSWEPVTTNVLIGSEWALDMSLMPHDRFIRARADLQQSTSRWVPPFRFETDVVIGIPGDSIPLTVRDSLGRLLPIEEVELVVTDYYDWWRRETSIAEAVNGFIQINSSGGGTWKILRVSGNVDHTPLEHPIMLVVYPSPNDFQVFSTANWRLLVPRPWIDASLATFATFPTILDLGDYAQTYLFGGKWQGAWNQDNAKVGFNHETFLWDAIVEDPNACAYNGVPIGFSEGCFIVAGGGAAWLPAIFHERGHNSQWLGRTYGDALGRSGFYVEAEANVMSRWSTHVLLSSDLVDAPSKSRLLQQWMPGTAAHSYALQRLSLGLSSLDESSPDPVWEGCFIFLAEEYGWDYLARYVRVWNHDPETVEILRGEDLSEGWRDHQTQQTRISYAMAALSYALKQDLRGRFSAWGFQWDDALFEQLLEHWQKTLPAD